MIRKLLFTSALTLLALGCTHAQQSMPVTGLAPALEVPLRGINIMDLGIAGNSLPGVYGTNYTKPELVALKALKERGIQVVRISFLWERIQPTLGGELNREYLGYLLQTLRDSDTAGVKVIVDMHNYGRYAVKRSEPVERLRIGEAGGPTQAQYADAWTKIAKAIRADAKAYRAVYAYDLMNEPYALPEVSGRYAAKAPAFTFENGMQGWTTESKENVLEHATRYGQGALKITVAPKAGSGLVYNQRMMGAGNPLTISNGQTIQIKGFVPESTPGTVKARGWFIAKGWKASPSEVFPITKGNPFELTFTPTEASWPENLGMGLDFIVDGSDGKAPIVFYVDEINQGATLGGLTPQQVWETYAQKAVDAIRATGDPMLIMVEGYDFSSATAWPTNHPKAWIKDPMNNIMYHAHLYMDNNFSGTYKLKYAEELEFAKKAGHADLGARTIWRARQFADWVKANNTRGFIGEFGWPNVETVGAEDAAAWDVAADQLLTFLDSRNIGYTIWGTGSWLGAKDNELNAYVLPPMRPFQVLSPAKVLEKHLGK